jgi:hypothetical protein
VISIYPKVAAIFPMGGVSDRLKAKKSPMGQKYKEEAQLQSFSPWSVQSDSGVGQRRGQLGRGRGMTLSFCSLPSVPTCFVHFLPLDVASIAALSTIHFGCLGPPQYGNISYCDAAPFHPDFLSTVVPIVFP